MRFGAAMVALAVGGLAVNAWLANSSQLSTSTGEVAPSTLDYFFTGIEPDTIDAITITPPGHEPIHLRRSTDSWEVETTRGWRPVRADRQARLFNGPTGEPEIANRITGSNQGSNPANHDRMFSVGTGSGVHVSFDVAGKPVEELLFGRSVTIRGGIGTFVRRPNDLSVYILEGDLADNFAGESSYDWVETRPFVGIDIADITRIRIRPQAEEEFTLVRASQPAANAAEERWRLVSAEGSDDADAVAVRSLLTQLERWRAVAPLPASVGDEWAGPAVSISIEVAGRSEPILISFGANNVQGTALVPARASGWEAAFLAPRVLAAERKLADFLLPGARTASPG